MLVRCQCGASEVTAQCQCSAGALTVRCQCGAGEVTVQCQCSASEVPVQCCCSDAAEPVQCRCRASAVLLLWAAVPEGGFGRGQGCVRCCMWRRNRHWPMLGLCLASAEPSSGCSKSRLTTTLMCTSGSRPGTCWSQALGLCAGSWEGFVGLLLPSMDLYFQILLTAGRDGLSRSCSLIFHNQTMSCPHCPALWFLQHRT